jgi:hypothetical protein
LRHGSDRTVQVRKGSIAPGSPGAGHFRSSSINGHRQAAPVGPVRATRRNDVLPLGLLNLRPQRIPKSKHLSGRGLVTAECGLHENKL